MEFKVWQTINEKANGVMLMTDMWQHNEQSQRNHYAPRTSDRRTGEGGPRAAWEDAFARTMRAEGRPYAGGTSASPVSGVDGAEVSNEYWPGYRSSHQGRSCSMPPHARVGPRSGENSSIKYHPYHEAQAVGKQNHQVEASILATSSLTTGNSSLSNSMGRSIGERRNSVHVHDKSVTSSSAAAASAEISEVMTSRESDRRHYTGGNQHEDPIRRSHDSDLPLPRLSVIPNEVQSPPIVQSRHEAVPNPRHFHHSKGRSRNDLDDADGRCSRTTRPDPRINNVALSSSETDFSLPFPEANDLYTGYEGHMAESYPRRYSSVLDDNPVIVHQYEDIERQTLGQTKHDSIPEQFPSPGITACGSGGLAAKDQYPDKDFDDHRQCHHRYQSLSRLNSEGEFRRRRSSDTAGIPRFPGHRFSDQAADRKSLGGSSTTASSPCADHSSLPTSSPLSLPPLMSTSPHVAGPSTAYIPKPNESSDSSFVSAAETSQPPSPSKTRIALARSHVPKKHSGKDLCVVCGDKASGYHYNTLSCEGCKGFFRRTITRNLHYHCKYGGNCVMDMWMRRKCPACRLKRCKQVGMREECLLTEHQCVIRNTRRKMKMKKKKDEEEQPEVQSKDEGGDISPDDTQAILASLNNEHRELIERLVNLQDKYELPSAEDLKLLREDKLYNAPSQEDLSDAIFVHMVEMTILVTRLIVEFAKNLPGFRNLAKEDQIVLLKSSSSEVMMLRTARRYNSETDTIVFGNGVPFSPSSMAFGGLQESVESLFDFSRSMSRLYVDNAEYALLTAMCIFSVRSGLTNPSVVDKLQEVYLEVLISYVGKRRTKCQNYLAKLLMKFVHLRTLGHEHSQTLYNLTLKKGSLPPLLTEYFDISE